jgi:hypothetical protein
VESSLTMSFLCGGGKPSDNLLELTEQESVKKGNQHSGFPRIEGKCGASNLIVLRQRIT